LHVARQAEPIAIFARQGVNPLRQIGLRFSDARIEPNLHPRRLAGDAFQKIDKRGGVGAKHIAGKPQPMDKRHRKWHVNGQRGTF
jgi:hypothetical protein